jgi:sialic acid synthase SpsE
VLLLKCTSAYPAEARDANLLTYGYSRANEWGLSDHTQGIGVACAAAAVGAAMIEKHITLSRGDGGPDAGFSLEPAEFAQLVTECRRAAASVGAVQYGPSRHESTALRRSLWVCKSTAAGAPLVLGDNVCTARPALGLSPATNLHGRYASRALDANSPLTGECIA